MVTIIWIGVDIIIKTTEDIGQAVRRARKEQGLNQEDLAGLTGVSRRFIVELEGGKATAQIGKSLHVISMLGVSLLATHKWEG